MLKKPLILIFVLLSAAFVWGVDYSDPQEKSFEVQGTPELFLKNADGMIEISPNEGTSVHVKVTKQIRGAKDEAQAKKEADQISIELEQIGNQIRVITHWPNQGISLGIHRHPSKEVKFEISTPAKSNVRAEVSDGELYIHGINGSMDLKTADGDISASELSGNLNLIASDGNIELKNSTGKMDLHLADGDLVSEGCSGSVHIRSGDGSVKLSAFDGEAEISNADGDINIDGVLKSMIGKVSDGSMTIRVAPGSVMQDNWSLRAADGDITLELPEDFSADLDISTTDGHVQTDHPVAVIGSLSSKHLTGKIRDGGYKLQIKTSDGNVAIK